MLTNYIIKDKIDFSTWENDGAKPHTHNFFELGYIISGTAEHTLNGETKIITKGNYYILDLTSEHGYKKIGNEPLKVINCLFMPEFIDKTLYNCKNFSEIVNNYMLNYNHTVTNLNPANCIFKDTDNKISNLLKSMLDEFENKSTGSYILLRCRLIEIIIHTMRNTAHLPETVTDPVCSLIIEYANDHFNEKNILGALSRNTHYSIAHLSRRFKEVTGESFTYYIKKTRIEQALKLLDNTNKKITDIAGLCGYSDMKFFNEIFKTHTGMTPRQFRQRSKNPPINL